MVLMSKSVSTPFSGAKGSVSRGLTSNVSVVFDGLRVSPFGGRLDIPVPFKAFIFRILRMAQESNYASCDLGAAAMDISRKPLVIKSLAPKQLLNVSGVYVHGFRFSLTWLVPTP